MKRDEITIVNTQDYEFTIGGVEDGSFEISGRVRSRSVTIYLTRNQLVAFRDAADRLLTVAPPR
jgi:hypothetical protein